MPSSENHGKRGKSLTPTEKGKHYEDRAARYFQEHRFEILERNWRTGHWEIDLIVKKDNLIVFVEVKSSASLNYGHPAEWVDARKINHLVKAAQQYLFDKNIKGCDLRFDVVTFTGDRLEHFPNAFPAE